MAEAARGARQRSPGGSRRHVRRPILVGLGVLMCAAVVTPAWAAPRSITGRLDRPGYTVIALGYNGTAASSTAQSFSIVPRDSRVTLQLRDHHGKYAGPIVVGRSGSRVVVGVRAGARLGAIAVLPRQGYARVIARESARAIDTHRVAQAHRAVPLATGGTSGLPARTNMRPQGRGVTRISTACPMSSTSTSTATWSSTPSTGPLRPQCRSPTRKETPHPLAVSLPPHPERLARQRSATSRSSSSPWTRRSTRTQPP